MAGAWLDWLIERLTRGGPPLPGERQALERCTAALRQPLSLDVAGHTLAASVLRDDLERFHVPVALALIERSAQEPHRRILAGIAGPPGSGKSVMAAVLVRTIGLAAGAPAAVLAAMDGFHYPNAWLDAHPPLRERKGAPETFDAHAFAGALRRLADGEDLMLPRYDRRVHDPVPDGVRAGRQHRIAVVEGNYLLLDRPGWREAARLLDAAIFLRTDLEQTRRGLIERHVRGGRAPADAERHWRAVDAPDHALCTTQAPRADLVVELDGGHHVAAVARGGGD